MLRGMANEVAVARAKARMAEGREQILARHRAGAGGQEVVRASSALTDEVISELFRAILAEISRPDSVPLSLVATGGYGRRAPHPRPAIDLLALLPGERDSCRARPQRGAEPPPRAPVPI